MRILLKWNWAQVWQGSDQNKRLSNVTTQIHIWKIHNQIWSGEKGPCGFAKRSSKCTNVERCYTMDAHKYDKTLVLKSCHRLIILHLSVLCKSWTQIIATHIKSMIFMSPMCPHDMELPWFDSVDRVIASANWRCPFVGVCWKSFRDFLLITNCFSPRIFLRFSARGWLYFHHDYHYYHWHWLTLPLS